jgi:hypothetical protein
MLWYLKDYHRNAIYEAASLLKSSGTRLSPVFTDSEMARLKELAPSKIRKEMKKPESFRRVVNYILNELLSDHGADALLLDATISLNYWSDGQTKPQLTSDIEGELKSMASNR